MKKVLEADEILNEKSTKFLKNINSEMFFKSEVTSNSMSFDWLEKFEFACPYIDNIVRTPKVSLVKEEDVVKIEKAKKVSVASVKDLSRHTHYIEKINPETNEVQPSKILIERYEETFNIYENRFIYTLINNMSKFISSKEKRFEDFETKSKKELEYKGETNNSVERISIELKITAREMLNEDDSDQFRKTIKSLMPRIKRVKDYIATWKKSEMIQALDKAHVAFVRPPIKKTNMILKNTNFKEAMKLWDFIQTYDLNDPSETKEGLNTGGDIMLRNILDDAFLMDYYVLDSISPLKREQKEKLYKYAVIIINQQIQRVVSLLLNSGAEISEEEILKMITTEIKKEKSKMLVGQNDVKKKFQSAMDEYIERTQDYL